MVGLTQSRPRVAGRIRDSAHPDGLLRGAEIFVQLGTGSLVGHALLFEELRRRAMSLTQQEPPIRRPGFQPLPYRWIVERTFTWIGRVRRMSRDYEFLPVTSEAWIYLSMVRLMLKRLAHESVQPAFHYRRVA